MIPVFRKIRKKMADDNRPLRYIRYAIGEIVLVVIGILIALQINNWNIEKNNRQLEKSILADIHQEFIQNKIQLDTVNFYNYRSYINCKKLVALFPIDIEKVNMDSLAYFTNYSLYYSTFNPSQGSINSIISTASFNIIKNDTLRSILISWEDLIADLQEDEIGAKNTVVNLLHPYFSKNIEYDFHLSDKRNNLKAFETMEFEFLMRTRLDNLYTIFKEGNEMELVTKNIDKIIELTKPKHDV